MTVLNAGTCNVVIIMDQVTRLLDSSKNYPRNLARSNKVDDRLETYFEKINVHQNTLFTSEEQANLNFCELSSLGEGSSTLRISRKFHTSTNSLTAFWGFRINNAIELRNLFGIGSSTPRADPRCRFLYVPLTYSYNRSVLTDGL